MLKREEMVVPIYDAELWRAMGGKKYVRKSTLIASPTTPESAPSMQAEGLSTDQQSYAKEGIRAEKFTTAAVEYVGKMV